MTRSALFELNVRPSSSVEDVANGRVAHAVAAGQNRGTGPLDVGRPNGEDFPFREFGAPALFSEGVCGAPLAGCVRHVVAAGANPQVLRVYAVADVAGVADTEPVRDRAVMSAIRRSVYGPTPITEEDGAITLAVLGSRPEQTAVSAMDAAGFNSRPQPRGLRPCQGGATLSSHIHGAPILGGWGPRAMRLRPPFLFTALRERQEKPDA